MSRSVPITITIGDTVLDAQLWDSPTAADLSDRLPLTLRLSDFGAVEKTARLPRPLTMDGVPSGADPEPFDIGYYQPDQVLVLYYRDVGFWPGIVRLGTFTDPAGLVSSQQQPFVADIRHGRQRPLDLAQHEPDDLSGGEGQRQLDERQRWLDIERVRDGVEPVTAMSVPTSSPARWAAR